MMFTHTSQDVISHIIAPPYDALDIKNPVFGWYLN